MGYSKETVAAKLSVSSVQLWRLVRDGKFAPADVRDGARVMWSAGLLRSELRRWASERRAVLESELAKLDALDDLAVLP
jgi:predicted DNA-binding transcriptional regulator AlpA